MDNSLTKTDEIQRALTEAGFNPDEELHALETSNNSFEIQRIRIDHKDNGKHKLYIDHGSNYLGSETQEEPIPDNTLQAVIFAEQHIRALWTDGEPIPICSSIDEVPNAREPICSSCAGCKEAVIGSGKCKPKMRLWLLVEQDSEIKPMVMNLSPTSLKHWSAHKRKLKRSKLPVVSVNTVIQLEDTKRNGYRWAEVVFDVTGVSAKSTLLVAKQARDELDRVMQDITQRDYDDPGDKVKS
ncbi:MAG: hypothetical protein GY839_19450 [candidate division Zixibacteria bacterium]|nr:hypothetical protein [candidate division Zixibacteria bacterium]